MHLDISLPLLSELEQHQRTFWNQHTLHQRSHNNQDDSALSTDHTHMQESLCPSPPLHPHGSNGAHVCLQRPIGPEHIATLKIQGHEQVDHQGEPKTKDSEGVVKEHVAVEDPWQDRSPSPQQKSPNGELNVDACSTCEKSPHSEFPDALTVTEPSQSPQPVPSPVAGQCHRTRRICRVLWDKTKEHNTFL